MPGKVAILLRGESFRTGNQNTRVKGQPGSVYDQQLACQSHIRFVEDLKTRGFDTHLYVTTYTTRYDQMLLNSYAPHVYKSHIFNKIAPKAYLNIKESIALIDYTQYDYIIIIRIDLFLKDDFFNALILDDKVRFMSVCWFKNRKTANGNPRINDVYYQFPRAGYIYLEKAQKNPGAFYHTFLDYVKIPEESLGFFTNRYYDSDSFKDLNPYYRIVNRMESRINHSGNKLYPDDFNTSNPEPVLPTVTTRTSAIPRGRRVKVTTSIKADGIL